MAEALAIIETQQAMIVRLEARVQELEALLRKDSSNSSKPPSSDPPWKPPGERRKKGRKRGGQPGHDGHERAPITPDEVVAVKPAGCSGCGETLSGQDGEPYRHQVSELPAMLVKTTEYQLHSLCCGRCGKWTRAALPEGVPRGAFGPRLQAVVAVCSGAYRLSKRNIEELMQDFFGVQISLGSVSNLEHATSTALEAAYDEALERMRKMPVVHADETGWYQHAKRSWVWVAATTSAVVFMIRERRTQQMARELLGKFAGILVTDQYKGYVWFNQTRRQLCWAHLVRHFRGLLEQGAHAKAFGERLLDVTERLFDQWHKVRDGTLTRAAFQLAAAPLQEELRVLLQEDTACPKARAMCKELLRQEPSLWTFARRNGVEPTNNAAERALRTAVLWRKSSFGTDSERGSRFVERMLTVVATLRLQRRNVLDFIAAACAASSAGRPSPLLLGA